MRTLAVIAALACAVAVPGAGARAQEWGGAAGVAAMRGYTASPGMPASRSGDGAGPAVPADAEALAAPLGDAPSTVAGLAGDVPARRKHATVRVARTRHGAARHRMRRA